MFKTIYVPVDNSEHSMRGVELAVLLAKKFNAKLIGSHAYAARMHDIRFKQMEYTLPAEYQEEKELEKQRSIHDTLITMGLELISDSYLQVMRQKCLAEKIPFEPRMYDGKNFKVIVEDINRSQFDLVIIGALGLGAVRESIIGSVCERVLRRTKTDTLVIKNTSPIEEQLYGGGNGDVRHEAGNGGHIVVCIDGSPESFAGLKTAIALGKALDKEVEAIAAYDPYLHYTMFHSISNVLTEKAAKVFKFKEQEKLHEDVIDTGLAKIYQSHLEVARKLAKEDGMELKITLLDGKAFEKIVQYVRRERPWLLVMGRIGVHSDPDMDIGSNAENVLRLAPCNILFSSKRFIPAIDLQAEESMVWTAEATALLNTAPAGVRGIAKTTIHRWAMERGHSVITRKVIEQAVAPILPKRAMIAMGITPQEPTEPPALEQGASEETYICKKCGYVAKGVRPVTCPVCSSAAEHFQKVDKQAIEEIAPQEGEIIEEEAFDDVKLRWTSEAKKALREVPSGYPRRRAKAQIEKTARVRKLPTITVDLVREVVDEVMEDTGGVASRGQQEKAETAAKPEGGSGLIRDGDFTWTQEAWNRLQRVPEGFMRDGTKKRMENCARKRNTTLITLEIAEEGIKEGLKVMEEMIRKQAEQKK